MKNIYLETTYVEFTIPPGQTVFLPLKDCLNNPFLNFSSNSYKFVPKTKLQFIGLVEYLPELVFTKYQQTTDNELFQDYQKIYRGVYSHLAMSHGYYTENLELYKDDYFAKLNEIYLELYELISLLCLHSDKIPHYQGILPNSGIWFSCLFNDLELTFLSNGLLGACNRLGKKSICNQAIRSNNLAIKNTLNGEKPLFAKNSQYEDIYYSKKYLLKCIELLGADNDYLFKRLKAYYRLENRFSKFCRDNSAYQVGFLDNQGKYVKGLKGKQKKR